MQLGMMLGLWNALISRTWNFVNGIRRMLVLILTDAVRGMQLSTFKAVVSRVKGMNINFRNNRMSFVVNVSEYSVEADLIVVMC